MCGICGVFNFDREQHVSGDVLEQMNRQLVHRGPDDAGSYISGNIGLAMRRLSIVDLQSGHQPLPNEDETIWLVFNGEIYNHKKLRHDLEERGHRYRTHSDTETIVHLYEEHGRQCVNYLGGMFAFAIWDSRRRTLLIARDRLGIKPLYFLHTNERLLFGSEIKALLVHPGVRPALNRSALPEFLAFGYLSGSRTMFQEIRKLLPAQTLEIDETGRETISTYWDVPLHEKEEGRSSKYYVSRYRELLEETVRDHLMSDVPLGMFLSGGIDSSAIAALMAKARKEPIESFAVGYDEEDYSELPYARIVANHIGSVHREIRVGREDFFGALPRLIWHEDEPLVWPSSISLYFVARLARERVKVVLTGEGSDETLGGYRRYTWTLWNSRAGKLYGKLMPASVRRRIRDQIRSSDHLNGTVRRRVGHTFLGRDFDDWNSFYFDNFYAAFAESDQRELLVNNKNGSTGSSYTDSLSYWAQSRGALLDRLLYTDIKTYLVELCMKQDQMSMAASIESRVPFLDHVLVEFAASIPARFKTRGLSGKLILKTAVKDLLPKEIIYRRKMGFPTPLASWLLGPQLESLEETLVGTRAINRGIFRREAIERIFAEHRANHRDHSDRIWRLLNLEIWHRVFVDSDPAMLESRKSSAFVAQQK
jgi:asparagine synthase (glutamine-hydrolysing)